MSGISPYHIARYPNEFHWGVWEKDRCSSFFFLFVGFEDYTVRLLATAHFASQLININPRKEEGFRCLFKASTTFTSNLRRPRRCWPCCICIRRSNLRFEPATS